MPSYSLQQGTFFAHKITLEGVGEDAFAQSLSTARVDMNPHQVDAALFALGSPLNKGVLLADEVGLGKTIEAALVIAQKWAERRRRVLLIVPASLRKQWSQELSDKFSLPSVIVEARVYNEAKKRGVASPFDYDGAVVITSYEFAATKAEDVARGRWDLVVFDEAHRVRNVYKQGASMRAKKLRDAAPVILIGMTMGHSNPFAACTVISETASCSASGRPSTWRVASSQFARMSRAKARSLRTT